MIAFGPKVRRVEIAAGDALRAAVARLIAAREAALARDAAVVSTAAERDGRRTG